MYSSVWSESELIQHTNTAFKSYHSVLALARSPLADSSLVRPLLVLDDVSPTATERGQALRLVLQWTVNQLAPARPAYPLGVRRPADDPTWQDPLWWRYNILRHRYLEPLHPDEFIEGARITETLVGRMGIPSQDTYFDERNRAVREAAQWLSQQMIHGQAKAELLGPALEAAYTPVAREPEKKALLDIAAVFGSGHAGESAGRNRFHNETARQNLPQAGTRSQGDGTSGGSGDVFPRSLLVEMARRENLVHIETNLAWLVSRRYLQAGDGDRHLWMSPVLQSYLYARQTPEQRVARHRRAARYFEHAGDTLRATRHLLYAQQPAAAANLLLQSAPDLDDEAASEEAVDLIDQFRPVKLPVALRRELQIRLADLLAARGERRRALAACRRALQATTTATTDNDAPDKDEPTPQDRIGSVSEAENQARIYRRMGKLYEKHNQLHALGYYEQAAARFPDQHPEFVTLLKDRGWLYILRQSWAAAEADLRRALALAPKNQRGLRADIDDALASLYRHQQRFDDAIDYARRALSEREALGDLLRVAHSFNNLGLIYNELGDFHHAIAAFEEANAIFQRLHNRELVAGARLNIGLAHHLDGRLHDAVDAYTASLDLCREIELPLVQTRAHANLAEALLDLHREVEAIAHWRQGLALSLHAGFDDEVAYFRALQEQFPVLQAEVGASPSDEHIPGSGTSPHATPRHDPLSNAVTPDPDSRAILELARQAGHVTPRLVMDALDVSKSTATRRLAALVNRKQLARHGEGRGVYYTLAFTPVEETPPAWENSGAGVPASMPGTARSVPVQAYAERLLEQGEILAQEFGVQALGVDTEEHRRWIVRFVHLPNLHDFFRLEAHLGQVLGQAVDLKPHDVSGEHLSGEIAWVLSLDTRQGD